MSKNTLLSVFLVIILLVVYCDNNNLNTVKDKHASISGTVVDTNNYPLTNAKVILLPEAIQSYTDTNGYFRFDTTFSSIQLIYVEYKDFDSFDSCFDIEQRKENILPPIVLKKQDKYILAFLEKNPFEVANLKICTIHIKLSLVTKTDTVPVVGAKIKPESYTEIQSQDSIVTTDSNGVALANYYVDNTNKVQSCFTFLFYYQNASEHFTVCVKN